MFRANKLLVGVVLVSLLNCSVVLASQKKKTVPSGTPVLWQEPTDISSRDLYLGPGGDEMKPDLGTVTFVKEGKGGWSTKYEVRDGAGSKWVAKVGKEAQSDTAANRLLWAVGYVTEVAYLAPHVDIKGKGSFDNVRFEARPKDVKRTEIWSWKNNPFVGKPEFRA